MGASWKIFGETVWLLNASTVAETPESAVVLGSSSDFSQKRRTSFVYGGSTGGTGSVSIGYFPGNGVTRSLLRRRVIGRKVNVYLLGLKESKDPQTH